jgi:hypothetical protein
MAHTRQAEIEMLPTDAGGLPEPLQTPTRHLLLDFAAAPDALQIGADITTIGGEPLAPGGTYSVQLAFWTPEAEDALAVGPEGVVPLVEAGDGWLVAESAVWSSRVVPVEPAGEGGVAFVA